MIQQLTPSIILGVVIAYFLLLIGISYFTGKDTDSEKFFLAGRKSNWLVVAFGMIGASLSGVTFISVPGKVGVTGANQAFSYMQVVLGYLMGYAVIALVLMPLYYRLKLTSIYTYLEQRLGKDAYKTGAFYFLLSRVLGASFRLYLVAIVMQGFVLGPMGIPFWATVATTIVLIWVYTFRGGINTIIWTDTLQTFCMLAAVVFTIFSVGSALETNLGGMIDYITNSEYAQVFFFEGGWSDPNNFFKQFISGALITIVMTGLDQDMMQKNLSCPTIWDAQKNMFTFSLVLVLANLLFLSLGALLYIYAAHVGLTLPAQSDELYPMIALQHLSPVVGIVFILGLIAAAYSSADSALTALTTSFCVDFLNFEKSALSEAEKKKTRFRVHVGFSVLLFLVIILFNLINSRAVIDQVLKVAGYTYGPLLGLFAFGMLTGLKVNNRWVIPICIAAPVLTYILDYFSADIFYGFQFGFLNLAVNGLLTFAGLLIISYHAPKEEAV